MEPMAKDLIADAAANVCRGNRAELAGLLGIPYRTLQDASRDNCQRANPALRVLLAMLAAADDPLPLLEIARERLAKWEKDTTAGA